MSHRSPILPATMKARVPGICRWCGNGILTPKGGRSNNLWHFECVAEFKALTWPAETRRLVFLRDRGICARCAADTLATIRARCGEIPPNCMPSGMGRLWQADHIRPLVDCARELDFFRLANLQTLCSACHVAKGVEDNARRRAANSAQAELAIDRPRAAW